MLGLLVIAGVLTVFIVKNNLEKKYGLVRVSDAGKYLYFIPFALLCTVNFWFGVSLHYDLLHQFFAVMAMLLVGYVEEIIFRGFLYRAIEKNNVSRAIIISAVTFGAGHIVNLLTGQASVDTFLQMGYAIAVGFAFVMVFYKSGSLLPCMITHSMIDISSKFSSQNYGGQNAEIWNYIATVFIIIIAGG